MPRLLKQILYGIFFLLFLFGAVRVIYISALQSAPSCFDNRKNGTETGVDCGGACIPCEEKNLQPIAIGATTLFSQDRVFSVAAELINPNSAFAASAFDYQIILKDASGSVLRAITNSSFLYAGERKKIVEAGVRITQGIPVEVSVIINPESIIRKPAQAFIRPEIEVRDVIAAIESGQVVISGYVTNINNFVITKIIINGSAINSAGAAVGVSKTEIRNVAAFGVENFKIFIPIGKSVLADIDFSKTAEQIGIEVLK